METPEGQNGEQQHNNNPPPPPPIPPNVINTLSNEENVSNQTEVSKAPLQEPTRIIIEDDKRKDNNAIIANWLSFLALCLAGLALFYTYKLYEKTIEANQTSKDALGLAREQFEQSTKDNEINRKKQEENDFESNVKYRKQFSLDSQSVQAQIDAFKEAQENFVVENRPFVQVYDIKIDTLNLDGNISFKVFNYGKFPANILYIKYRIGVALRINPDKITYLKWQTHERKIYVVSGLNSLPEVQFMKASSNDLIKAFKDGQIITYLDVEIKYNSYIPNKTFLHTSLNEIRYGSLIKTIRNDDTEVKR